MRLRWMVLRVGAAREVKGREGIRIGFIENEYLHFVLSNTCAVIVRSTVGELVICDVSNAINSSNLLNV